jgi:hypothetical protein
MKKPRTFEIDSTYVDRTGVPLRNAYVAKEMDAWLAERDKELAQKLRTLAENYSCEGYAEQLELAKDLEGK